MRIGFVWLNMGCEIYILILKFLNKYAGLKPQEDLVPDISVLIGDN